MHTNATRHSVAQRRGLWRHSSSYQRESHSLQDRTGGLEGLHTLLLHTAMQYSSDSKLLRLPPQPPKVKGAQRPVSATKYQRNSLARHGPFRAGAQHTADKGEMLLIIHTNANCIHMKAAVQTACVCKKNTPHTC